MVAKSRKSGRKVKIGASKKVNRVVKKLIKTELKKDVERKVVISKYEASSSYMAQLYTCQPLYEISVGTGSTQRLGNQVNVQNVRCRLVTNISATSQSIFRVIGVWLPRQYSALNNNFNLPPIDVDLFYQITGNAGNIYEMINNKLPHRVVYDKLISVTAPYSTAKKTTSTDFNINMHNKKVTFGSTNLLTDENFYITVIPYTPGGTPTTTSCGYIHLQTLTTFTDL